MSTAIRRQRVEFAKNPQRRTAAGGAFRYRRFVSTCGQYAVERSAPTYTRNPAARHIWRALIWAEPGTWRILSTHRTRRAAERACNHHRKEGG